MIAYESLLCVSSELQHSLDGGFRTRRDLSLLRRKLSVIFKIDQIKQILQKKTGA